MALIHAWGASGNNRDPFQERSVCRWSGYAPAQWLVFIQKVFNRDMIEVCQPVHHFFRVVIYISYFIIYIVPSGDPDLFCNLFSASAPCDGGTSADGQERFVFLHNCDTADQTAGLPGACGERSAGMYGCTEERTVQCRLLFCTWDNFHLKTL